MRVRVVDATITTPTDLGYITIAIPGKNSFERQRQSRRDAHITIVSVPLVRNVCVCLRLLVRLLSLYRTSHECPKSMFQEFVRTCGARPPLYYATYITGVFTRAEFALCEKSREKENNRKINFASREFGEPFEGAA
ncbi:hypothetical protein X777_08820 [Ooceraea biroi]|uniref:Uncharacterized protein n=1 Tax=Ooceraea biroi TaxID=2015173 RepID=A0A026W7P3_OOCBI|nr:hypothetical protein X777_08820 [Ooceraea biroi]